jgi:two-component system, NarL family, response regulator FusR
MSPRAHKIFLVDDHPLVREGLAGLINRLPDFKVCGEAETANEALRGIVATQADAAIVDLTLREGSGIELIKAIRSQSPDTAILVLSMHDERRYAERCIRAGARGYVMKAERADAIHFCGAFCRRCAAAIPVASGPPERSRARSLSAPGAGI